MRSCFEVLDWFEDLVDFGDIGGFGFTFYAKFLILVLGLLLFLNFHLFPIAPLLLWVYNIVIEIECV